MADQKHILELCVDAGETLLRSGGEIFRVQETMERIAKAYGAEQFHVYVLTNGLFASVDDEGHVHNGEIRHVPESSVHLGRVTAVNALSREIEQGKVPIEEAFRRLAVIRAIPYTPHRTRILMCAVGAASFAYLFGGGPTDALAAFVAGLFLQLATHWFEAHPTGKIVRNILLAALVALCSFGMSQALGALGLSTSLDYIIIGGIIPLVPGMALTTSIRDFANGDYLSGAIRLLDALLIAASIAIGVGMVLKMLALIPGVSV